MEVVDRSIEEKVGGFETEDQIVSVDIGNKFIKTVSGTVSRLNTYAFLELKTWSNEDMNDVIFVHGTPFLYGSAAEKRYIEDMENFNIKKIEEKPLLLDGNEYEFFKAASHQLIMSEMKKIGIDLNANSTVVTSLPNRFNSEHFTDYSKHLEFFYDHDKQFVHTITGHFMPTQFGVFFEAFRKNNGNNILTNNLANTSKPKGKTILSIDIGSSSVNFVLFKEDMETDFSMGSRAFIASGENSATIVGRGTESLTIQYGKDKDFISFLYEMMEFKPTVDGKKDDSFPYVIKQQLSEYFSSVVASLPSTNYLHVFANVDTVVVGGGGSVFLSSDMIKNALSLDDNTPILFSEFPLHSSALGMYLELKKAFLDGKFEER